MRFYAKKIKYSPKTFTASIPISNSEQNLVKTNLCAVLSSGKKAHHWKCIDMIVRLWVVNLKLTGKLVRFLAYLVDPHHKNWVKILFKGGFLFLCTCIFTRFFYQIVWKVMDGKLDEGGSILFIHLQFNKKFLLKFSYSEKTTELEKNLPISDILLGAFSNYWSLE